MHSRACLGRNNDQETKPLSLECFWTLVPREEEQMATESTSPCSRWAAALSVPRGLSDLLRSTEPKADGEGIMSWALLDQIQQAYEKSKNVSLFHSLWGLDFWRSVQRKVSFQLFFFTHRLYRTRGAFTSLSNTENITELRWTGAAKCHTLCHPLLSAP